MFGMASGKGMFGKLPQFGQSGAGGLLGMLLSHGGGHQMLPDTNLETPHPLAAMGGPGIAQASASLPQMAVPGQALGYALGGQPHAAPGIDPPQLTPPHNSGILQSVMGDQGPQAGPMSLSQILMRLGAMRQ